MKNKITFNEAKEKNFKILEIYVPVVDRVHGAHHPEFHKVRAEYDEIVKKVNESGEEVPKLDTEFKKLREITDNYTVPGDVCESYDAVYTKLKELDNAYQG